MNTYVYNIYIYIYYRYTSLSVKSYDHLPRHKNNLPRLKSIKIQWWHHQSANPRHNLRPGGMGCLIFCLVSSPVR